MLNLRNIPLLLGLSLLAACTSTPPVGGAPGLEIASVEGMPQPTLQDYTPTAMESVLRPLDVLQVEIFGVEELNREVQVGVNGKIDYPLIGSITVVGRTLDDIVLELEARLRDSYVRDPDVTARITERAAQNVTVGGEVARPGRYPVEGPITLMEALALGGGMDENAAREEVLVFRTVGDDRYIGVYNVKGISRGNYADPTVYPSDIVVVGDSPGRRRLERILGIVTGLSSPLFLLERVLR